MPRTVRTAVLLILALAGVSGAAGLRVKGFSFSGVSNRFVTPNGDGKNDTITFVFNNPRDSSGSIKIYDLRGHLVSTIPVNPGDTQEVWNGAGAATGVYIYVIRVEDVLYSGTVVVIR